MDYDLFLVIGLIIAVFSVPAVVSAVSDNRTPRVAAIALIAGGAMMAYAVSQNPSGYSIDKIPNVVVDVIAKYIN
ncbi:hypothetical protein KO498_06560 [Lentibacter algarum]|uniref:hypothetical protein n=1 Tax=Lentibacter algarum TaxID=576131 RepID=UPI001C066E70|nr:hypothetical protein [Lentibacter algarum]MBU2981474.1 hypothetical protein [Lentibacter algarum]